MANAKKKPLISTTLQDKLKNYGLLTTGLLLAGNNGNLNAAIVYNDIADVTISIPTGGFNHDRYRINFDASGPAEIDILVGSYNTLENSVSFAASENYPDPTYGCAYYSPPCVNKFPTAGLLPLGTIFDASTPISLNAISNTPVTGNDVYTGASFVVGTDTFYGWARFRVISTGNPRTAVIYDYAYESTPNLGIEIGETMNSLPVELTNFEARLNNAVVKLNWETASELNNEGFFIQRSKDGNDWEQLGFVEGNGTINIPQSYTFEDERPLQGTSYYRLEQKDFDGKTSFSHIEAVEISFNNSGVQIFPNPIENKEAFLRFESAVSSTVELKILDLSGKEISNWQIESQEGINDINLPLGDLESGIYFIHFNNNGKMETKKIVL